ncbi:flagellar biosynthetic protein FliO [Corticimicrobacter populi]|uniref:Flagellar protein n=1 Tax=Corticimicrobacter populi TaxID=2175229 RepID=A0A2V1JWL9_9BURK|nr:flagellar biosynthetic protein FliO [Corticimicrobacter populi]PWF21178.1 flagellar biosynthetic protein FliO [Corticimicrobacter populi]
MTEAALIRVIAVLILIICMILAAAWLVRRLGLAGTSRQASSLRLLGSLGLGPRHRIAIIEADGTRLVVGLHPNGINLLHTFPPSESITSEEAPASSTDGTFKDALERAQPPSTPQ